MGRATLRRGFGDSGGLTPIGGPGTAGVLISLLTAPLTLAIDAASFIVSAVSLGVMRHQEERPPTPKQGAVLGEIGQGLRFLYGHPVLSPLTLATGVTGLWFSAFLSVYFLYLSRGADLPPSLMGLILSVGAVGAAVGALVTGRLTKRFGYGPTVILCQALFAVAAWVVPLAGGPVWLKVVLFAGAAIAAFSAGYSGGVTATLYAPRSAGS